MVLAKPKKKLLVVLLLLAVVFTSVVPSIPAHATVSSGGFVIYNDRFDMKGWTWHKDSKGRWWYGKGQNYAYMATLKIKNKYYAFDEAGYLMTNCFVLGYWADNDGALHKGVKATWQTVGKEGYRKLRVTNTEGYKCKYLSGKNEYFGEGFSGMTSAKVRVNNPWSPSDKLQPVFKKTGGYVYYCDKLATKSNTRIEECDWGWTSDWGYDSYKKHENDDCSKLKHGIRRTPWGNYIYGR
jgi:hypothetical protein